MDYCYYYYLKKIYTPGSIDPRGYKLEAKNKYHWWLEVRVFVGGVEGIHNEDWVEALNNNRKALK